MAPRLVMELHFDIGRRITGDMLIAALLDAFPGYENAAVEAIEAACEFYPVDCRLEFHDAGGLRGHRFVIEPYTQYFGHLHPNPHLERETWAAIRRRLLAAPLPEGVRRHALGILRLWAQRQAARHDVSLDAVSTPTVEVWQLLAHGVGAAALIDGLGAARWIVSSHDLGGPTLIARAILGYVGALPSEQPAEAAGSAGAGRAILRSGVGFAAPSAPDDGPVRVACFDELAARVDPSSHPVRQSASQQKGGGG